MHTTFNVSKLQSLKEALELVGTVRFIQRFDTGSGDYTKEKYMQPDFTLDEIIKNR